MNDQNPNRHAMNCQLKANYWQVTNIVFFQGMKTVNDAQAEELWDQRGKQISLPRYPERALKKVFSLS